MKTLNFYCLITLLLCISTNCCIGQTQNHEITPFTALYPFEEDGLYGLMDSVGRVAIKPQFSAISGANRLKNEVSIKEFERRLSDMAIERSRDNSNAIKYNKRIPVKHRKNKLSKVQYFNGNFLLLPYKNHAFYFSNEWAVIRVDGIYGYINYKGEIRLNPKDSSKAFFRSGSVDKIDFNWELKAEKIRTKIELLHPNKYNIIRPIKDYPHLVIVFNHSYGSPRGGGLLKIDTLKNITETIIPTENKYIEYDDREGFLKVTARHATDPDNSGARRYFNLSAETFSDVKAEKIKSKVKLLYKEKYEYLSPLIEYPHLILVWQNSKKGLIKFDSLKNKIETIIPIDKNSIRVISNEWHNGLLAVEDEQGKRIFDLSKETYQETEEEIIKNKIELLHPNKYESIKPLKNNPHLIIVKQKIEGTNKVGLLKLDTIKNTTETIIPISKNSIYDFNADLLKVIDEQGTRFFRLSDKTYFFDVEKIIGNKIELLHPNKYESLKPHLIIASQKINEKTKTGLLKYDSLKNKIETIIPFHERFISNEFDNGLLKVGDVEGTRLFRLSDETFLSPVFAELRSGQNGCIAAKVNNKWGVLDSLGNWLYPPQLYEVPTFQKDLIHIISNEKRLFIDENGELTNSDFEIMGKYGLGRNLSIFHLNSKYGIINTATKDTVLAPNYDDFNINYTGNHHIRLMHLGVIKIIKNNKTGLINLEGELIAPCIFTDIRTLIGTRKDVRHFYSVNLNNKLGIIDVDGNEILKAKYEEIKKLDTETIAFKEGKKWGYVYLGESAPINEIKVVAPKYSTIRIDEGKIYYKTKSEEKEKILNPTPNAIIRNLKFEHQSSLNKTFIIFRNANEPWGIYNSETKKIIVPPTYDEYFKINAQLIALKNKGKWSIFNFRNGVFIHKDKFNDISRYRVTREYLPPPNYGSCIPFCIDKKWGLMNAEGKIIFDAQTNRWPSLSNHNYFEIDYNDQRHRIDTTGKIIYTRELKAPAPSYGSCIPFKENNLWGLKNAEGKIILDAQYKYCPQLNKQNHFKIYIDDYLHLLDSTGKIVLATDITETIPLKTGKTEVKFRTDSKLWGIADSNYQVIFHPQFEEFKYKDNWIIQAKKQEKWYWLKPDFTLESTDSIPKFAPNGYPNFGYDTAYPYNNYNTDRSPYFTVIKNAKKGLIDTLSGKEIIPPEYDKIILLYDSLAVVEKDKKHGLLNFKTNTVLQPIIFDEYKKDSFGYFKIRPKKAYINYQGEFVWKQEYFELKELETIKTNK